LPRSSLSSEREETSPPPSAASLLAGPPIEEAFCRARSRSAVPPLLRHAVFFFFDFSSSDSWSSVFTQWCLCFLKMLLPPRFSLQGGNAGPSCRVAFRKILFSVVVFFPFRLRSGLLSQPTSRVISPRLMISLFNIQSPLFPPCPVDSPLAFFFGFGCRTLARFFYTASCPPRLYWSCFFPSFFQ